MTVFSKGFITVSGMSAVCILDFLHPSSQPTGLCENTLGIMPTSFALCTGIRFGGAVLDEAMIVKHMAADGRDMYVSWYADFGKMKLDITVESGLISTSLLKCFLDGLHQQDERFEKTKIVGALRITREFQVTLILSPSVKFDVQAYRPNYPDHAPVELDLILMNE